MTNPQLEIADAAAPRVEISVAETPERAAPAERPAPLRTADEADGRV